MTMARTRSWCCRSSTTASPNMCDATRGNKTHVLECYLIAHGIPIRLVISFTSIYISFNIYFFFCILQALFNVKMISKQKAQQINPVTTSAETELNPVAVANEIFAKPQLTRQRISAVGMSRRTLLTECADATAANQRAARIALEETINEANCNFVRYFSDALRINL